MQIHELTKLTEAGVMDYLKAAVSRDPALANMSYDQKIKAMQNDESMKKLAQVASQNWVNKTVNLQRANMGQPISDQEYTANLTDFVNKVMLGGQMNQLDPTSKARVDQLPLAPTPPDAARTGVAKGCQISGMAARAQDQVAALADQPRRQLCHPLVSAQTGFQRVLVGRKGGRVADHHIKPRALGA